MDLAREFLQLSRRYFLDDYQVKIERCLELLTDEQIWWRANEHANSIGNLLLHMCGNVRQYVVTGVGGAVDIRRRQEEFDARGASREELVTLLESTLGQVEDILGKVEPWDLLDLCVLQGREMSKFEAIYHAVEHFSMHTGQIILITKQLVERDLGFYAFKNNGDVERRW
ncbi:MAG: DinB family protein [Rhodothermales bacterium]